MHYCIPSNLCGRTADINLGDLQKTLDAQGLEIIDNQKENMMGRKKLAEQTRGKLPKSPLSYGTG